MFVIDPLSLILSNGLMSAAMAAVLLVSRIGLGAEGRGIRSWVAGDLAMSAGRISAAATMANFENTADPHFPAVTAACFVFGTAGHLLGLRRAAGLEARPLRGLGLAVLLALVVYVLLAQIDEVGHRIRWMGVSLGIAAAITLWVLQPLLHLWGARLIGATMGLAIVVQGVEATGWLFATVGALPDGKLSIAGSPIEPLHLGIDLVIALFVTGGFLLLLQERLRERIERLTVTDALTGALNRRGLMPLLTRMLAQSQRSGSAVSVVMFDVDHFKRVNDQHGHAVGDRVLAGFATRVGTELRAGDALARWGGEEFLMVLPDTPLTGAMRQAERLRQLVGGGAVAEGTPRVTVSAGVATVQPLAADRDITRLMLDLLDQADRRLYLAKRERNCVVGDDAPPRPTAVA